MSGNIDEEDDEMLNLRIQCREPEAIAKLIELHGPRAKGYLRKQYRLCDADIDTVLFEAVDRAWRYGDTYDPKKSLKSWFFRILQRQAITLISGRKERREVSFILDDHDRPEIDEVPVDKRTKQRIDELERCIERLIGNQQAIIREDLKSEEIADSARLAKMLGSTINSIQVSRNKARVNLKKCVEDEIQRRNKGAKS